MQDVIINYAEIAVKEVIDHLYESSRKTDPAVCDCPSCRNRAMARALNILKPCYVTSEAEYAAARANYDSISERARLIAVVMDSIREVSLNPAHDERQAPLKKRQAVDLAFA
ncbi:MAG: late competence development ComFB family protein [Peptococcaceae bacterium]|nr:late competence development ComFB family protein [Peptococcaceae bacterium]